MLYEPPVIDDAKIDAIKKMREDLNKMSLPKVNPAQLLTKEDHDLY